MSKKVPMELVENWGDIDGSLSNQTDLQTALNGKHDRYNLNTQSSASSGYILIEINSYNGWMLAFTVTLYQGYRATKILVSGYNYGNQHWYSPQAVYLGDSGEMTNKDIRVYFGYTADYHLYLALPRGNYTGISISDVTNGYVSVSDYKNLFTISFVSSLSGTIQVTKFVKGETEVKGSANYLGEYNVSGNIYRRFRKEISVGALSVGTHSAYHNITGLVGFISVTGRMVNTSSPKFVYQLPYSASAAHYMNVYATSDSVAIYSSYDFSGYTGIVTIEYYVS